MIFIEVVTKLIVNILSISISVHRSQGYTRVLEKFYKFDDSASRTPSQSNVRSQTFYLLYVLLIGVHNFVGSFYYTNIGGHILVAWNVFCSSTMLIIVQYISYIRMLRDRYQLANRIFKKSEHVFAN